MSVREPKGSRNNGSGESVASVERRASPGVGGPELGVLGGMGPMATVHFYRQLVTMTPATRDQDHLRLLLWADPSVPDRTEALLGRGLSPLPAMAAGIGWLLTGGVRAIAVPCNTAHAYFEELRQLTGAHLIDMVGASVAWARQELPGLRRLGVLCTDGTRHARLYEKAAAEQGVELVQVSASTQRRLVNPAIAAVKEQSGSPRALDLAERRITGAAAELVDLGVEAVVAACTEIPLVMAGASRLVPMIDSTECLAAASLATLRG